METTPMPVVKRAPSRLEEKRAARCKRRIWAALLFFAIAIGVAAGDMLCAANMNDGMPRFAPLPPWPTQQPHASGHRPWPTRTTSEAPTSTTAAVSPSSASAVPSRPAHTDPARTSAPRATQRPQSATSSAPVTTTPPTTTAAPSTTTVTETTTVTAPCSCITATPTPTEDPCLINPLPCSSSEPVTVPSETP